MGEMQPESDAQLLRAFAERGVEAAFTELVQRHTNLVYSAALRQVESPDVAAEVAQKVFISLASGAKQLVPRLTAEASLAGWLCRSARNLSLNHRRDEFRRHTRERQAMEQLISIPDDAPNWEHLRPILDDTLSQLDEADYDALVLRYFQNQDFRTVGAAIGVSDDTAQKRVARALSKLRELLAQRGIRTTASALGIIISANAVKAAPVGLAVTISTAALAGTAATTSTLIAATTKTIAMTTLQKTLVIATVVVLAGAGIYEARQAAQLRDQVQTLQQQQAPLVEQIQQLQSEHDDATNRLAGLREELALANTNKLELLRLRGEVGVLRRQLTSQYVIMERTKERRTLDHEAEYNGKSVDNWVHTALWGLSQTNAMETYGAVKVIGAPAAAMLVQALTQTNSPPENPSFPASAVRQNAFAGLEQMGSAAKSQVPELIELLKYDDKDVRIWATLVLAGIGSAAKDAIPALMDESQDINYADYAKEALRQIKQ